MSDDGDGVLADWTHPVEWGKVFGSSRAQCMIPGSDVSRQCRL